MSSRDATTLIAYLVERALAISRSVARLLIQCESLLLPAKGGALDPNSITARELLQRATEKCGLDPVWFLGDQKIVGPSRDAFLERLARVVLRAWSQQVRSNSARRPDVLSLSCRLLANPDAPHSYNVARFCMALTLRSLYSVPYSLNSISQIRESYDALRVRFELKQKRRQKKSSSNIENLLLDVLCLDKWVYRSLRPAENLKAYYQGFEEYPLGVDVGEQRRPFSNELARGERWPELSGRLPDFGRVLNLLFAQPTGIHGWDDVTGGLVAAVPEEGDQWPGGLVTLIAGPPGSGKTSLCLSITSRMAQLGSVVRYITTEERACSLFVKRTALAGTTAASLWPDYASSQNEDQRFKIVTGSDFDNLTEIITQLERELTNYQDGNHQRQAGSNNVELFLVFPTVIVIDSLTALLQGESARLKKLVNGNGFTDSISSQRKHVSEVLNKLRKLGVCVFLIGGLEDSQSHGLHYLVDNTFSLDIEGSNTRNQPIRVLSINKTRLQTSDRGRHTFHISRTMGCRISPSLHSVLRSVKERDNLLSDPSTKAVVWAPEVGDASQRDLFPSPHPILIRNRSHTLVYGQGSSSKAKFGLTLTFEPRIPIEPANKFLDYVKDHAHPIKKPELKGVERACFEATRVLVISFLYGRKYYHDLTTELFQKRFGFAKAEATSRASLQVTVHDFYPGSIDAETVIAFLREHIRGARLEGRPYARVLIDGIHNVLVQFPLLVQEPLFWPTLYRLLRTEGLDTITTFSFFQPAKLTNEVMTEILDTTEVRHVRSERFFFHSCISGCDYAFLVGKPTEYPKNISQDWVRVRLEMTIDPQDNGPEEFWWDPGEYRYREAHLRPKDPSRNPRAP